MTTLVVKPGTPALQLPATFQLPPFELIQWSIAKMSSVAVVLALSGLPARSVAVNDAVIGPSLSVLTSSWKVPLLVTAVLTVWVPSVTDSVPAGTAPSSPAIVNAAVGAAAALITAAAVSVTCSVLSVSSVAVVLALSWLPARPVAVHDAVIGPSLSVLTLSWKVPLLVTAVLTVDRKSVV